MKQIGPLLKLIRVIISRIWQANHGLFWHIRGRDRHCRLLFISSTVMFGNYMVIISSWLEGRHHWSHIFFFFFLHSYFATRLTTFKTNWSQITHLPMRSLLGFLLGLHEGVAVNMHKQTETHCLIGFTWKVDKCENTLLNSFLENINQQKHTNLTSFFLSYTQTHCTSSSEVRQFIVFHCLHFLCSTGKHTL